MKLRIALSALTVAAVAVGAPVLAAAQTPSAKSGATAAATAAPKTAAKTKTSTAQSGKHHVSKAKTSHRRHKLAVTKTSVPASKAAAAPPAKQ